MYTMAVLKRLSWFGQLFLRSEAGKITASSEMLRGCCLAGLTKVVPLGTLPSRTHKEKHAPAVASEFRLMVQ